MKETAMQLGLHFEVRHSISLRHELRHELRQLLRQKLKELGVYLPSSSLARYVDAAERLVDLDFSTERAIASVVRLHRLDIPPFRVCVMLELPIREEERPIDQRWSEEHGCWVRVYRPRRADGAAPFDLA